MLLEGIRQAHELVAQQEEEMRQGAVPQIFRDYANAGEEAKAAMKVSSRQGNEDIQRCADFEIRPVCRASSARSNFSTSCKTSASGRRSVTRTMAPSSASWNRTSSSCSE